MRFSAHSDGADGAAGRAGQYSPSSSVQLGCAVGVPSSTSISLALPCKNVFVYYFSFFLICSFNLLPPRPSISCCSRAAAALSTPDMSALYPCLFVVYWWHDKQGKISVHSKSSTTIFLILEIHSLSLSRSHYLTLCLALSLCSLSCLAIVFVCTLTSFCNHARHKSNLIVLLIRSHTHTHPYTPTAEIRSPDLAQLALRILNICSLVRSLPGSMVNRRT